MSDDGYKPRDDFAKSITACYEAIKERVAHGGKPWRAKMEEWYEYRIRGIPTAEIYEAVFYKVGQKLTASGINSRFKLLLDLLADKDVKALLTRLKEDNAKAKYMDSSGCVIDPANPSATAPKGAPDSYLVDDTKK